MEGLSADSITPQGGVTSTAGATRSHATVWLIAALSVACLLATGAAWVWSGPPRWFGVAVLGLLAALSWFLGSNDVQARVYLSFSSIIVLAAAAMLGPVSAAVVGALLAGLQRERVPMQARVFNITMSSTLGLVSGITYILVGGSPSLGRDQGTGAVMREIFFPLLIANVVLAVTNVVFIALIVRVDQGIPMRLSVGRLLTSTVPVYIGFGGIAFLLVMLWRPVGLGPASAGFIVALLLGARWAYLQHAEERQARGRALAALVAALELKSPRLTGHSSRVADLATAMGEELALRPQEVSDIQTAATLHDVGLVTLPTSVVRQVASGQELTAEERRVFASYPARSLELVGGLSFLAGSLDAIAHHRVPAQPIAPGTVPSHLSLAAHIVGVADHFDLLTQVGADGAAPITEGAAVALLRAIPRPGQERVVDALALALTRREVNPA